jgi:hypothetical protein
MIRDVIENLPTATTVQSLDTLVLEIVFNGGAGAPSRAAVGGVIVIVRAR